MPALLALVAVTAVWGVTFVQVKDAVELYPLFAVPRAALRDRVADARAPGRRARRAASAAAASAAAALAGALLAARLRAADARARADERLERRLRHRDVRRADAAARARALPAAGRARGAGSASCSRPPGSRCSPGVPGGSPARRPARARRRGGLLAPDRADGAVRAALRPARLHAAEMLAAFAVLAVAAIADGSRCRTAGRSGARCSSPASSRARSRFLVQTWAQRRTSATRTALVFTLEPVWAALFGFTLAGDRLGALGWAGCAVIMAGIVLAEPAAADVARAPRAPAAGRMTAVVLALASAAFFGAMTVAIRLGLRAGADARPATLATLLPALAVALVAAARRAHDARTRLAVRARRPDRAGLLADPVHALDPRGRAPRARRSRSARRRSPRSAIAFVFLDEPVAAPLVARRARDRRRRRRARRRARPARAPPGRGLVFAVGATLLLRGRATTSSARCTRDATPRPRRRRRCSPAALLAACTGRGACRAAGELRGLRAGGASASGSRTSASSRRTSAAGVGRLAARRDGVASGASACRRSCSARARESGGGSCSARCSSSRAES